MILSKVYEDAENRLERNEITLGEFERLVDIEVIEPKRGEWIDRGMRVPSSWVKKCSLCGHETDTWRWCKFCPNCGADMRERESE